MLKIAEVRRWAKDKGYIVTKHSGDEEKDEPAKYSWYKIDDPTVKGEAPSVSKVATAVFNHITNYEWVEYQEEFKKNKDYKVENGLR